MSAPEATRKDIDDILNILNQVMTRNDEQFMKLTKNIEGFRAEMNSKLDQKSSRASNDKLGISLESFKRPK